MTDKELTCYCGENFSSSALVKHFSTCSMRKSSHIYNLMQELLPYATDELALLFLELELTHEARRMKEIRTKLAGATEEKKETFVKPPSLSGASPSNPNLASAKASKPPRKCGKCSASESSASTSFLCGHLTCFRHLQDEFRVTFQQLGAFPCFDCKKPVMHKQLRELLGDSVFDEVLSNMNTVPENSRKEAVVCECGGEGEFRSCPVDYSLVDSSGEHYSLEAAEAFARLRYCCAKCGDSVCMDCKQKPFHDALTCAEAARVAQGYKCRYCDKPQRGEGLTCGRSACEVRLSQSCRKVLPCSHKCFGVRDESVCPPCLQCSFPDSLCIICGTEWLSSAPIVVNRCSHAYHFHCLETRLRKRWTGSRISFAFASCPLCKDWTVPPDSCEQLYAEVVEIYNLYEKVKTLALKRFDEEPEEQKQVFEEGTEYYQQPELYVMDRYCYYECCKCKRPYFGGKKQCNIDEEPLHNSAEEKLCLNCSVSAGARDCRRHGLDFMEYKCRYCCSVAKYFCWGTSHFCENCHSQLTNGRNAAELLAGSPKCKGTVTCPLKVEHPPNGIEFLIGCGLCRNERNFNRK